MKQLILCSLFFLSFTAFSQKHTFIHFFPKFGNLDFQLNTNYIGLDGVTVEIDHFNYYISDIVVIHDGGITTSITPNVFLIKPDSFSIYLGDLNLNTIEQIQFMVGVPQRFNTQNGSEASDISSFPLEHPLSFQSPSMYWGWQAGYMHMIVGGNADGNNDQVPESYFELHNLGNNNQRMVNENVIATATSMNQLDIYMECHLEFWLKDIAMANVGVSHGSTGMNIEIMENVDLHPVFVQPVTANDSPLDIKETKAWSYNSILFWKEAPLGITNICDITGKVMMSIDRTSEEGHALINLPSGLYLVSFIDEDGNVVFKSNKTFIMNVE